MEIESFSNIFYHKDTESEWSKEEIGVYGPIPTKKIIKGSIGKRYTYYTT